MKPSRSAVFLYFHVTCNDSTCGGSTFFPGHHIFHLILCLTTVVRSISPQYFRKFLHILATILKFYYFNQCHSNILIFFSYPNSCFADYENNLPTGIQYFADYLMTRGGGGGGWCSNPTHPFNTPPLVTAKVTFSNNL